MKLKSMLLAGACTIGLGGPALAFDQSMIDTIAGELAAQGYTKLEVKIGPNGAKVEAKGPNGELERYYDASGNLIREESQGGGTSSGSGGNGLGDDSSDDDSSDDDSSDDDSSDDDSNDDDSSDDDSSDDDSSDDDSDDDDSDDD